MSNPSQQSLLGLKAITAEHADRFQKEGRTAVRGAARPKQLDKAKAKDPFDRPSPGLVKRLAREARNDAKQRSFVEGDGPSDEQRRAILEAKAKKYEALKRGDLSGFSERELAEANLDFTLGSDDDGYSDHSSDEDESARPPRRQWDDNADADDDDMERVEYVDEMGRTRFGTRKEARAAERERDRGRGARQHDEPERREESSSYAEVQKSTFIHGDQNYFPVYQPDPEALKQKYLEAEREARAHHYDSTKEVRTRGAGAYQFSLDEEQRAQQMASLDAERRETERVRASVPGGGAVAKRKGGMSAAQEAQKRRLHARDAVVAGKRAKLASDPEEIARRRRIREAETEQFFSSLDDDLRNESMAS